VELLLFNRILVNQYFQFMIRKFVDLALRDTIYTRAEIITILAVADRLYSEVEENVPDPSSLAANRKEIEAILEEVELTDI